MQPVAIIVGQIAAGKLSSHLFEIFAGKAKCLQIGQISITAAKTGTQRDASAIGGDCIIAPAGYPQRVSIADPVHFPLGMIRQQGFVFPNGTLIFSDREKRIRLQCAQLRISGVLFQQNVQLRNNFIPFHPEIES